MESMVDALLIERIGYLNRNLPERVRAVDLQLRKLGIVVNDEIETTTIIKNNERTARPKAIKKTIKK